MVLSFDVRMYKGEQAHALHFLLLAIFLRSVAIWCFAQLSFRMAVSSAAAEQLLRD